MVRPELLDISIGPQAKLDGDDVEHEPTAQLGWNRVLTRRLGGRGVGFAEIVQASWAFHPEFKQGIEKESLGTGNLAAALVADLERRGLLDSTLVLWSWEFGPAPTVEDRTPNREASRGRYHHRLAFSMCHASGGVRPSQSLGQTDDLGLRVTEYLIGVDDLQALILNFLGLDHTRPTFRHKGRDS